MPDMELIRKLEKMQNEIDHAHERAKALEDQNDKLTQRIEALERRKK